MYTDENDDSLQSLFVRLTHLYFRKIFLMMKETEIHPRQFPLICLVGKQEGISQKKISEMLKISAPTVAVSVKRLEKAGMVERKNDEKDQRVMRIYLTEKGRRLTETAKMYIEENEKALFRGFSESELCLMKRFFKQMADNLEGVTRC